MIHYFTIIPHCGQCLLESVHLSRLALTRSGLYGRRASAAKVAMSRERFSAGKVRSQSRLHGTMPMSAKARREQRS